MVNFKMRLVPADDLPESYYDTPPSALCDHCRLHPMLAEEQAMPGLLGESRRSEGMS